MLRRILGPVAATVLVAAVGVLGAPAGTADAVPQAAARAGACSGSDGVTAIVDFNELGGGVTAACDPGGGGKAASQLFPDVGYPLTYAQEGSGFVCRVSGEPAEDPCVRTPPATASWSLWWSDGKSEKWVYSSDGVGSLTVPDGGYVALAWHQGSGSASPPDVVPSAHDTSTPSPTGGGGAGGSGGRHHGSSPTSPASPSTTGSSAVSPSSSPTASSHSGMKKHHRHHDGPARTKHHRHPGTEPTPSASADGSATPAAGDITAGPPADVSGEDDGSSFPVWLGVGIAVVVLGAAVAVPVLRRRAG